MSTFVSRVDEPAASGSLARVPTPPLRLRQLEAIAVEMALPRRLDTPIASVGNVVQLMVRVEDVDGVEGWGEIWCNFPRFGVHHRLRLLKQVAAPLVVGREFAGPEACYAFLTQATRVLRLQAGEPGPVSAVIAGIDIALWDLAARKAGLPLWKLLGAPHGRVATYLSVGWSPDATDRLRDRRSEGIRAVKVRSAGDLAAHRKVAFAARDATGPECEVMLDMNSSWDEVDALRDIGSLGDADLAWLEEPVPVDVPDPAWSALARAAPMPLAGGENMLGEAALRSALSLGALSVLQPDLTKWGGFSGILPCAREIVRAGRRFAPHMFGGAVGTLAAATLLAAADAPGGILEWGVNHNPVRDALMRRDVQEGAFELGDEPGLGLRVDPDAIARYRIEAQG